MSDVKIDSNVPMPKRNAGVRIYPWDDMKIGDSFAVDSKANPRQLCVQANLSRPSKRFEARVQGGNKRIWRTK